MLGKSCTKLPSNYVNQVNRVRVFEVLEYLINVVGFSDYLYIILFTNLFNVSGNKMTFLRTYSYQKNGNFNL